MKKQKKTKDTQKKETSIFDNPFKQLDKKNFRDDKKHSKIEKKTITQAIPTQEFENEEDLFLFTMANVNELKNNDKYNQKDELQTTVQKSDENLFESALNQLPKKKLKTEKIQVIHENIPEQKQEKQENMIVSDEEDFFSAFKDVKPLNGKKCIAPPEPEQIIVQKNPAPLLYDFEEGKLEFSLSENTDHVQCNILGLDLLTLGKLQNRHFNPEAHLDLHGLKAKEAFHALVNFMRNAYLRDMRCVLLITGKGLNSYDNKPFLRSKVSTWLIEAPFKFFVLAFCTAKAEDGGSGALYILLRKKRKNSPPIPWERIPNDYDLWADMEV